MAAELLVKLGIRVSPRTARRIHPGAAAAEETGYAGLEHVRAEPRPLGGRDRLFVVATPTVRVIYVFVVLDVGTRCVLHRNVTAHPTADWTAQQFGMMVPGDQAHRFVIHDRDTIYTEGVDRTLDAMGLAVLKPPARVPQACAFCEAPDRHDSSRVFGFRDSRDGAPPSRRSSGMDPS